MGESLTDAAAMETLVGSTMDMQAVFVGSGDGFPSAYAQTVRDQGKTLIVFWEPTGIPLDTIIAGEEDVHIQQFVSGAELYAGPVIFVPFAEMNGNWSSWGGTVGSNSPSKFISAWQHIHDQFASAQNVKFGWAVNHLSVPDSSENEIGDYYPGAAYVDYVGADGFNFDNPWTPFSAIFNDALTTLKSYNKPIMIFSMACAPGAQKAGWITDALVTQMSLHPEVVGWLWFNVNKETDWRVNSDPAALSAFQAAVQ